MKNSPAGLERLIEKTILHGEYTHSFEVLHEADGHLRAVVNYENYHLLDNSHGYNRKKATEIDKFEKRMKLIMKEYKFDAKDSIPL